MLVAAHPDDEAIGAAVLISRLPGCKIIHVTDGAPRNLADADAAGYATWEEYAAVRATESERALSLLGIASGQVEEFGMADQQTAVRLGELARLLVDAFRRLKAVLVLTHPYEGGHPDHDSTCFAVHAARCLMTRGGSPAPALYEFTSYHQRCGKMASFDFLPDGDSEIFETRLSAPERELKKAVLAAYTTQQRVLQYFPLERERMRQAPQYDFTMPPHAGALYYDQFEWGIRSSEWRLLARRALENLHIGGPL